MPIDEAAVRQIANNSMALDVYCWLAYRLHALPGPTPVSWAALYAQFGQGYARRDHFRGKFKETLELAMSVYPAADVTVAERGLLLKPSRRPVAGKSARLSLVAGHTLPPPKP